MRNRSKLLLAFSLSVSILFSGCWDKVEIDRRHFISTIGIDIGTDIGKIDELKKIKPGDPFAEVDIKKLSVSYNFPDISQLGPQQGGVSETKTITTEAYSMEDAISKAIEKSSRSISFAHTEMILLGSEFFAHPDVAKEVIDYLQRQPSLNRTMLVIMTLGKVEDFLKYKPEMEKSVDNYLGGLIKGSDRKIGVIPITLDEFMNNLITSGNVTVPCIALDREKNELKLAGTGIIKNYKMIDTLSVDMTEDVQILQGKLQRGKRVVYKEGHPIDFEIEGIEKKMKVREIDDKLEFDINLNLEGEVKGYYVEKEVLSRAFIEDLENNLSKSLKDENERLIKALQNKYESDLLDLKEYVQKFHPLIWNRVKDNWDEVYKNAKVNVNCVVNVRRIGQVK